MTLPVVHGKKLAWVPDKALAPGEPRDLRAKALLGDDPPPASSSNGDLVPDILNQGQLGSCTAHGSAQALRALQILQWLNGGKVGPMPTEIVSRLWAYWLARKFDGDPQEDAGAQIRNIFAGLARYGAPAESTWTYDDTSSPGAKFSQDPGADAWRAAIDAKFAFSAHRITSVSYERVDDIKRALGQRRLVVFGTMVGEDFCSGQTDPTKPLDPPTGNYAGGHCMAIQDHNGDVFNDINSWSAGWGNNGRCLLSADYLAWVETSDIWVVDAMPVALVGGGQ